MIVDAKATAQVLQSGLKSLQGVSGRLTELIRHEKFGTPTKLDRGGIAVDLMSSGLLVRQLGPTQVHVGEQMMRDAQGLFKHGANLDRVADHVLDGISALDGRLRHTAG